MGQIGKAGAGLSQLFGSEDQQLQAQQTQKRTQLTRQDEINLQRASQSLRAQQTAQQLQGLAQEARGIQAPTLETAFARPNLSGQLDPISQALISQGTQDINQRVGSQNRAIAQQFQSNPALAQILQAQGSAQGRLAANPLLFQARQQQTQRSLQQAAGQNAAIQAANQARLAQQQSQFGRLQGIGQFLGGAQQSQQGLLASLLGLGQLRGTQFGTATGTATTEKGGVLSGL